MKEKIEEILIECAKIYNRVWREKLKGRDWDEIDINEEYAIDEEAFDKIREYLEEEVGLSPDDYEFCTVYCNCSEIPFPRDEERIGLAAMAGRGVDCPGLKIKVNGEEYSVCLCCGR